MGEQKVIFQTEITCIVAFFVALKFFFLNSLKCKTQMDHFVYTSLTVSRVDKK